MKIKMLILLAATAFLPVSLTAAILNTVEVDSAAINCVFSSDCSNRVLDSSSPIKLPGTSGIGYLQTRVVKGEDQSAAEGLYGYQYRIDLSAVEMNPNRPPCFTNVARCFTNRLTMVTNLVVCRTNGLTCVTNVFPATNVVVCFTNALPAREVLQCITDAAGVLVCFTNNFPATNVVFCMTNRLPRRITVTCSTNSGTPVEVTCVTNRVQWVTNMVVCETNLIPCPGTTPCIETVTIDFGRIGSGLDFNSDGSSNDQAYFVMSAELGTLTPDQVVQTGRQIVLHFSPPICPGNSSVFVGLVSSKLPRDKNATLALTSGGSLSVSALVPAVKKTAPDCDFGDLIGEIKDLKKDDLVGSNNRTREARRDALLQSARAAKNAAEQGNVENLAAALGEIISRVDGGDNDWVTNNAAKDIREALRALRDCLSQAFDQGDNGNGDDDDDNDDNDDNNDQHGQGHLGNGHHGGR